MLVIYIVKWLLPEEIDALRHGNVVILTRSRPISLDVVATNESVEVHHNDYVMVDRIGKLIMFNTDQT